MLLGISVSTAVHVDLEAHLVTEMESGFDIK